MNRAPLDAGRLRSLLHPRWAQVEVVSHTTSTNADLLAAAGRAPDRTLLVAEEQGAGRGRFDRVWTSPPRAGLLVSMLLRPSAPVPTWGWLPLLAGVALAETVREHTGVAAALKWPNDLLDADGAKLAGVLVQAASGAVVIGVGLNVSTTRAELPVDTASSLVESGATDDDRTALLAALAGAVDGWVTRWDRTGGDARACGLAQDYLALCDTVGRDVTVAVADGRTLQGRATGVDDTGRIEVLCPDGPHVVSAGDVAHLRPA